MFLIVMPSIKASNASDIFPIPHKFRSIGADEAEIISANTPANF